LDENNDVSNAELFILIRDIDHKFSPYKELASVSSLYTITNGEDLFTKVEETHSSLGLKWGAIKD
jgi:hypothetical protein